MSITEQQSPTPFPPEQQDRRPGLESEMTPQPLDRATNYRGSGKLAEKVAIVTGGDSGIGRSVAIHFAKEGADVVISYLNEHNDAQFSKQLVGQEGWRLSTPLR